jgi:carboxyl-terminal processing protease
MQRRSGTLMWVCLFLLLGVFVGRLPATIAYFHGQSDWQQALAEVQALIKDRYVEPVDEHDLLRGAIRGMTDALDDPYTEFIEPDLRDRFEREMTGQFVGIGALVGSRGPWLTINYPLEDSPALEAGLCPGDRVIEIDQKSARGLSIEEGVKRIVGEPGTSVSLLIRRATFGPDGAAGETDLNVTIQRRAIAARSVKGLFWNAVAQRWEHTLDAARGVAYVRLTQFTPGSAGEVRAALDLAQSRLNGGRLNALVLDLRGNPGGLLDQAVDIVNLFVKSGRIVSTRGRTGPEEVIDADGTAPFPDLPVCVLVDGQSASASEIVAGALQDNQRAMVVGSRSFGKGLVQRIEPIPGLPGAQLKLTEQHYYLPSGRLIQRTDDAPVWGVDPSPGGYLKLTDPQARALFEAVRALEVIRPRQNPEPPPGQEPLWTLVRSAGARWNDPEWIEQSVNDPVLALAVRSVRHHSEHQAWPTNLAGSPDVAAQASAHELQLLDRAHSRLMRDLARVERRLDALESGRPVADLRRPRSFWDDELDLSGGKLKVVDKDGKTIASLRITGPDLERWLVDADLEPEEATPAPAPGASATPTTPSPAPAPPPTPPGKD